MRNMLCWSSAVPALIAGILSSLPPSSSTVVGSLLVPITMIAKDNFLMILTTASAYVLSLDR